MEKDLVSDIKMRLSIEDVIGSYITLIPSGSSYKALSPFKSEKTASLMVTPTKDIWKDFSSGKGGSMFNFVMEYEGVDFKEALAILAEKAGLNMADYAPRRQNNSNYLKIKTVAFDILELATKFYQDQLINSSKTLKYIKNRGFNDEIVAKFRLGYAPGSWEGLYKYFVERKISIPNALKTGLIVNRPIPDWLREKDGLTQTHRFGDFFANRLLIPLSDSNGKTIGFTGRVLSDKDKGAKYINTKQTFLYNKSKHIFGYFQAKEAIRKSGYVLVVEGNLDVVACHQFGFQQTVAAGGTALTLDHLKIISRLTKDIRLAFDGDSAGITAMERSIIMASKGKVNLSVVSLPSGSDPDDLLRNNAELFKTLVDDYKPALDWLYDKYASQLDIESALGKKQFTDIMLPIVNNLEDEVEKEHYLNKLALEIKVSKMALNKKLDQLASKKLKPDYLSDVNASETSLSSDNISHDPLSFAQADKINLLIGLLLVEPKLRDMPQLKLDRLSLILQKYDNQFKIFKILQQTNLKLTDVKKLPDSLQPLSKNVIICLDIFRKATPGGDFSDDFDVNSQAFQDLYRQLDILQLKVDKQASN